MIFLSNYHTLIKKIDLFCLKIETRYTDSLVCQKGCSCCCRHITLFPVEALALNRAFATLPRATREKIQHRAETAGPDDECPLLENGGCLMYLHRPVICRTHGLPILVKTRQGFRMDHCPLNFTTGEKPERAFTLDLEQVNTLLSTVNDLLLSESLDREDLPERIFLSQALLMEWQPE
jgi:Fe-S-cluster containining protein